MPDKTSPSCPRCQMGYLQPVLSTYTRVHNHMLLSVPDVPAWKCDICQYLEYDDTALIEIEALVGQPELPPENSRPASKPAIFDADVGSATPRLKH
jgi:YgiT-type zinc finger domain-containing protein